VVTVLARSEDQEQLPAQSLVPRLAAAVTFVPDPGRGGAGDRRPGGERAHGRQGLSRLDDSTGD